MPYEIEIKLLHEEFEQQRRHAVLILRSLSLLHRTINELRGEIRTMANDQQALDASIAQLSQDDAAILKAVNTTGTAVSASLQDLLARIVANPTAPVSDFTSEIETLNQVHADFTGALTSLQATAALASGDDPGAQAPVDSTGDAAPVDRADDEQATS